MPDYALKALFVAVGALALWQSHSIMMKTKDWLARAGLHAAMGLTALLMANCLGALFDAGVGLNRLTVPVSAALGVPGMGLLWAVKYLL